MNKKKIIISSVIGGVALLSLTTLIAIKNNSNDNQNELAMVNSNTINTNTTSITNENSQQINNSNSEFEKAIFNLKNAKSVTIDFEHTSENNKLDWKSSQKNKLIIDYKNNLVKQSKYYSYESNFGESDTNEVNYWDISKKYLYCYGKNYSYDSDKWWYVQNEENKLYSLLEEIKQYNDTNVTKKVSNNYRVVTSDKSLDIGVEEDKIKYIYYSYSPSSSNSQSYQINFENYDNDYITLPNDVKNALSEYEFESLYGD